MIAPLSAPNEDINVTSSFDLQYWYDEQLFDAAKKLLPDAFAKIHAALPYIEELHERFKRRKRTHAHILGCKNWRQFCEERLQRQYQTIYKALKRHGNRTPKDKKKPKPTDFYAYLNAAMGDVEKWPTDRPLEPAIKKLREFANQLEVLDRKRAAERHAEAKRIIKKAAA